MHRMQLAVPNAVRNAVSAATTIFTTISNALCFFSIIILTLTITLTLTLILTQISRISRIFFVHEPSARRSQFHGFERKPLKPRSVMLALRASF